MSPRRSRPTRRPSRRIKTEAPAKSDTPDVESGTAPDGGPAEPEVAPDVVDAPTTLTLAVTPVSFNAGDSITITATVSPIPSCGTIEIIYNGSTTSGLAPDLAGQASPSRRRRPPGLKSIDAVLLRLHRLRGQQRNFG